MNAICPRKPLLVCRQRNTLPPAAKSVQELNRVNSSYQTPKQQRQQDALHERQNNGNQQTRPTTSQSRSIRLQQTQANPKPPNQIPHRSSPLRRTNQNHSFRTTRRPNQPDCWATKSIQIPSLKEHCARTTKCRLLGRQSKMVPLQNSPTPQQEMGQRLVTLP